MNSSTTGANGRRKHDSHCNRANLGSGFHPVDSPNPVLKCCVQFQTVPSRSLVVRFVERKRLGRRGRLEKAG